MNFECKSRMNRYVSCDKLRGHEDRHACHMDGIGSFTWGSNEVVSEKADS